MPDSPGGSYESFLITRCDRICTGVSLPAMPCRAVPALPRHDATRLAAPGLAAPGLASPAMPCHAAPGHAAPRRTTPCHACLAVPCPATPRLACRAQPSTFKCLDDRPLVCLLETFAASATRALHRLPPRHWLAREAARSACDRPIVRATQFAASPRG